MNNQFSVLVSRDCRLFWADLKLFKMVLFSMILALAGLSAGCSDKAPGDKAKAGQTEADEKEKAPIPVEVVTMQTGDIAQTYRTITTLEAENEAEVVARTTGIVERILVEEGDRVTKGQLLAQLDVEQLTLELQQHEATLNRMKGELKRQRTLFKQNLGQNDQLERAKFDFQSQQAQYQLTKLRLQYAGIKAPISGMVTARHIKQGNLIRENALLFNVVDLTSLIAVLHLPEKELSNVKKDQPVLLNIDAMKDVPVVGKVDRIRPSVDSDTGTFRVIASLDNHNGFLKSGMFGKVEIIFDVHQNALILQQDAVITQDNRAHVFVVKDGIARQQAIEVGFKHDGMVEVLTGLKGDEQIVVSGQQIIKHESKVEIVGNEPQTTAATSH